MYRILMLLILLLGGCEDDNKVVSSTEHIPTDRYAGKDEEWMISKFGRPGYVEVRSFPGELRYALSTVYKLKPNEEGKACYYDNSDGGQQVLFLVRSEGRPWLVVSDIYVPPGTKY